MNANRNYYCIILAGGSGIRIWPVSRRQKPKQFIDLLGKGETMLQSTYKRFAKFIDKENILVSTNEHWQDIVREQLPDLPPQNLLLEPLRRNTLPAVFYACTEIGRRNREAAVVITPCDQNITDMRPGQFQEDMLRGLNYASHNNAIITVGVPPSRPEVSYGYIQMGNQTGTPYIYKAQSFTEKPKEDFAEIFYESGEFLWNTGIFIWGLHTFRESALTLTGNYAPMIKDALVRYLAGSDIKQAIHDLFTTLPNLTIENSFLEKIQNVYVMLCHFAWADLGTWDSVYDFLPKDTNENAIVGNTKAVLYDCKNCIVRMPENHVVVAQGLEDYVIIESDKVIVICKKEDQGAIRKFVNNAQLDLGEEYL